MADTLLEIAERAPVETRKYCVPACDGCMGCLASDGSTVPKNEEIVFHPHVFGARPQVTAFKSRTDALEAVIKARWKVDGEKFFCPDCQRVDCAAPVRAAKVGEAKQEVIDG